MKKLLLPAVAFGAIALPAAPAEAQMVVVQPGFHHPPALMHRRDPWRGDPRRHWRHPGRFDPRFHRGFRGRFDSGFFFGGFSFGGGFGGPPCRFMWWDGRGWRCR